MHFAIELFVGRKRIRIQISYADSLSKLPLYICLNIVVIKNNPSNVTDDRYAAYENNIKRNVTNTRK